MQILIADDDPLTADQLEHHCLKIEPKATVLRAAAGPEAAAVLRDSHPDLVLLDLDMPGMSGRELLEVIDPDSPVIIITGDPSFALDAFRFNVVDYLVKPVPFDRFAKAWRKAMDGRRRETGSGQRDLVFIRTGPDIVQLSLSEVRYIKSESNYVRFALEEREVSSLLNMKDLELKLPDRFVRVHRSYIVNLTHVEKLNSTDVKIGRDLIPVSETYRAELIKRLDLL
ncbi:MAG: response regulator transcription factor [Flavobacteriales bacterium]|nr:response regulator transcription factor [Flavobacteriales bacterium]